MVKIRLARKGARRRPFFRIVVTDGASPRDGRNIERLGFFNPVAGGNEQRLKLDTARMEQWLAHGAQPSERAMHLFKEAKRHEQQAESSAA